MKKLLLLTVTSTLLTGLATFADDQKPAGGPGEHRRMDPAERLKIMTEKLGLTQDQQDKIKAIFEKNAGQFKELTSKGRKNLTEDDKTKLRELMKSQSEEIAAVLTPEQKEKWKTMREHERGGRGGKPGDSQSNASSNASK